MIMYSKESTDSMSHRICMLFREAILTLEQADHDDGRIDVLRASARSMVDAFLAVRGSSGINDDKRLALICATPILDKDTDAPLRSLLESDAGGSATCAGDVRDLEVAYRALLPVLRTALATEIPGHSGLSGTLHALVTDLRTRLALVVVGGLLAIASVWYQMADPHYNWRLGGKVYWKTSVDSTFSEARSQRFDVQADDAPHEYVIHFDPPITMTTLRLDPVDSASATDVRIRRVRLLGPRDTSLSIAPDSDAKWVCRNCLGFVAGGDSARLQPANNDPYLISPAFQPTEVAGVELVIRATVAKSFWAWITRLEESDD